MNDTNNATDTQATGDNATNAQATGDNATNSMTSDDIFSATSIFCAKWLAVEAVRYKYDLMTPGKHLKFLNEWQDSPYDDALIVRESDAAIQAIKNQDYALAKTHISAIVAETKESYFYRNNYQALAAKLEETIDQPHDDDTKRDLESIWFDMVHNERSKSDKGVPATPDLSKFGPVETLATIIFVVFGVGGATMWASSQPSLFTYSFPTLLFLGMTGIVFIARRLIINYLVHLVVMLAFSLPIAYFIMPLSTPDLYGATIYAAWLGGILLGEFIGNDWAYKKTRKNIEKYHPLTSLWARSVDGGDIYECVLVDENFQPIWQRKIKGFVKLLFYVTGADVASSYYLNIQGYAKVPQDTSSPWLQLYPAMVTVRMCGYARQTPRDLYEAINMTDGLTREALDQHLAHIDATFWPPNYTPLPDNAPVIEATKVVW